MRLRQLWREYFSFSRRERNGVFILLSILTLEIVYLYTSRYFYPESEPVQIVFQKKWAIQEARIDGLAKERARLRDTINFRRYSSARISQDSSSKKSKSSSAYTRKKIEINSADTLDFQSLKGIGPSFARRMVKYRELLGGYLRMDQLLEVYGMDSSRYALILPFISLNPALAKKIDLNHCSEDQLKAHPYIRWKLARVLTAYRTHHGPFSSIEDIRKIDLVTDSVFAKIAPYLKTN